MTKPKPKPTPLPPSKQIAPGRTDDDREPPPQTDHRDDRSSSTDHRHRHDDDRVPSSSSRLRTLRDGRAACPAAAEVEFKRQAAHWMECLVERLAGKGLPSRRATNPGKSSA